MTKLIFNLWEIMLVVRCEYTKTWVQSLFVLLRHGKRQAQTDDSSIWLKTRVQFVGTLGIFAKSVVIRRLILKKNLAQGWKKDVDT